VNAEKPTITRKKLEALLSMIRYPEGDQLISQPTLYRWCQLAGVPTGRKAFTLEQACKLKKIAEYLQIGFSYDQIRDFLGGNNANTAKQDQAGNNTKRQYSGVGSYWDAL
jgi:hypothetical protein